MKYFVMLVLLLFSTPAFGSTVTFTDIHTHEVLTPVPLSQDGRFSYRIQAGPRSPASQATQSVEVTDDVGQLAPACYPLSNDMTISVTSEVVAGAHPEVRLSAKTFATLDCTGPGSIASNPVIVEFVPEPAGLLAPLAP